MAYGATYTQPYYEGAGASALVPHQFDCSLNGRPFMFDTKYLGSDNFARTSIRLLKPQVDDSAEVSDRSLNPEEFARRSVESWHHGAGQQWLDRLDSDPYRFRSSKGVAVFSRNELSLLPDTDQKRATAATNPFVLPVGGFLYAVDGQQVFHTADVTVDSPVWTDAVIHVGEAATTVQSITTDGFYAYVALGVNGIHRTERGTAVSAHWSDLQSSLIAYVKGRLMAVGNAANDHILYNVTAAGAAPAALYTHPNTDFTFVGFAGMANHIIAAGYSGDKSILYRIGIQPDGTALTTPVVAGELPDGEIVRSVEPYLGQYLLIGTDKGFRLAVADTNGNLTLGSPVEIGVAVRCFEPQGAQVWFGHSNYDAVSTGLGRMDLRYRTDDPPGTVPVPAYASDLMVTAQGNVISVATFQNIRVFGIAGSGVWAETTTKVPTGTIDSGFVTFGLGDRKVMMYADVRHAPLVGSVSTDLSVDGGAFVAVGSNSTADTTGFVLGTGERVGDRFELRLTLARAAAAPTTGPTVTRHSLEANPAPGRGRYFTVPLKLWPLVVTRAGTESQRDIEADYLALLDMEASGLPITYVDATGSHVVFLEDDQWVPTKVDSPEFPPGTFIARLKKPRQR